MNALESSQFDNPSEYDIQDVMEAYNITWDGKFQNFCYAKTDFNGMSDQEIVLGLARAVINLADDYKRAATLLHAKNNQ
jgi:hypothetical protein